MQVTGRRIFGHPADIVYASILDVTQWSSFRGYGPIPPIESARYEHRTEALVGSRIVVHNTDGSRHVETIVDAQPPHLVTLDVLEITSPLRWVVAGFSDRWAFEDLGQQTRVTRTMVLQPSRWFTAPLVAIVALLMGAAVRRHLATMVIGPL